MNSYIPLASHEKLQSGAIAPLTDTEVDNVGGGFVPVLYVLLGVAIGVAAGGAGVAGFNAGRAAK